MKLADERTLELGYPKETHIRYGWMYRGNFVVVFQFISQKKQFVFEFPRMLLTVKFGQTEVQSLGVLEVLWSVQKGTYQ